METSLGRKSDYCQNANGNVDQTAMRTTNFLKQNSGSSNGLNHQGSEAYREIIQTVQTIPVPSWINHLVCLLQC